MSRDWPRYEYAHYLRESGETLASIGNRLGVSRERVRNLCAAWERYKESSPSFLSVRARNGAVNALCWNNPTYDCPERSIASDLSDEQLVEAVKKLTDAEILRVPNVGRRTLAELRGMPWPATPAEKKRAREDKILAMADEIRQRRLQENGKTQ